MPIPNTFTVTATLAPTSTSDVFAVTDPKYGKGSLRTVANNTERDAISSNRKEEGMLVYVVDTGKYFQLLSSGNWQEVAILPVDSFGNIHINGNLIVSGYIETDTGIRGNTNDDNEYLGIGMDLDGGTFG